MGNTITRPESVPAAHSGLQRLSVLVADSDADTRQLHRQAFEFAGSVVIDAGDGRDALTKALLESPSLVVMEMSLPFIDGVALCELLRRDPVTAAVPILVVTADVRPARHHCICAVGADAVLTKPVLPDAVLDASVALVAAARTPPRRSTEPVKTIAADTGDGGARRERMRSKSFARFETSAPPAAPPTLTCPFCYRQLSYDHSHVGGVSDRYAEQWDYYGCATCGTFQYRHRTRKLRQASGRTR